MNKETTWHTTSRGLPLRAPTSRSCGTKATVVQKAATIAYEAYIPSIPITSALIADDYTEDDSSMKCHLEACDNFRLRHSRMTQELASFAVLAGNNCRRCDRAAARLTFRSPR